MKRYFALVLLALSLSNVIAQKNNFTFSNDTTKFTKELEEYFYANTGNKKEAEVFLEDFSKRWKSNLIAGFFKQNIIEISNLFVQKKLKPYPYFVNYYKIIYDIIENNIPKNKFDNFYTVFLKALNTRSIKNLQDILDMCENLYKDNTFYTASFIFKTQTDDFILEFDSVPRLSYKNTNIIGKNTRNDSIAIEGTSGFYYPNQKKIFGKGGKVSWRRTGLPEDVFAEIKKYVIDCRNGTYTTDSAVFHGKQYFDKPQVGKLTDKIITEKNEDTYPRFDSYSKRLTVKNIYPNIDYDGGFGMRGDKFVGVGNSENPAKIILKKNDRKFVEVSAPSFAMNKEKIAAYGAELKMFLKTDSIYHPYISFNYDVAKKKMILLRGDKGIEKTPFTDTYHKVDIYVEQIEWNTEDSLMSLNFLPTNMQGEAFFESENFYSADKSEALKVGGFNIVQKIYEYYNLNNKMPFTVVDLAHYVNMLQNDLRPIIMKVASFNVIFYNPSTDVITVKQKLLDYMDYVKHKKDYDRLTIHSVNPGKDNAILNLLNFDMRIYGVKLILLSDTQKVFVFPKNQMVILKKNRNFNFSGTVASGKFEFHGKDFVFDYDEFKVKMKTIDSIKIYVETGDLDEYGQKKYKLVQTKIEDASGELRIDAPKNKSGWGKAPSFPIFQSFKESYAYYDSKKIFKGVYNRNNFYFKLDPFTIDSLDNFRNERLRFDGTFSSAGIFPTFRETLTLQSDYSLGFIRKTPDEGFDTYGKTGNYKNEIRLSNRGLRGTGDLKFSNSVSHSDDFIFFPDSTNGVAQTFDIKEQDNPFESPMAHGDTVYIHFLPKNKLLQAKTIKKPIIAYKEKVEFLGRLDLTEERLTGNGKVDFEKKANLTAQKILFNKRKFFSDTCNFYLKALQEEGFAFSTNNMNAKIDFDQRVGEFITNGRGSFVRFDKNQYIAYMDRLKWYMDDENIELGDDQKRINTEVENDLDIEGPEFISVHPQQDSLRFFAPAAKFNLKNYIINCINVPFIKTADAKIFPDNGKVVIYRNAVMDTLKNANLLCNTVTKYHNIRKVTANILSRRDYIASGEYIYVDENEKQYPIFFKTIRPDTSGETKAVGTIDEKDNFKFNDFFTFAGTAKLSASNKFLRFEGGTKIEHPCAKIKKAYLKFEGDIDPTDIQIPVPPDSKDMFGNPVVNAIMYAQDTTAVYSGFVSPKYRKNDKTIVASSGFLTFDKDLGEYQISSKEKLTEFNLPGNYLSLNVNTCEVYGEGKMDMALDLGQVKMNFAGNAKHITANDSLGIQTMLLVDFFFDKGLLKTMAKDLDVYLNSLTPTDFSSSSYPKYLSEFVGKEKADKIISDLNLYGNIKKFPDALEKTFFFNDVTFIYDAKAKSFISKGKLGLANILDKEVYRKIPGIIKIDKMKSGGDKLTIYLEPDPTTWYYFEYFKGVMKVISSNKDFNNTIKEMKSKNRKQDVDKGPSFQYTIGNETTVKLFKRKLEQMQQQEEEQQQKENKDEE
ncbi:MAG TPA: hypothetical protein PK995_02145 [Bacteroidia bacterium]|nr:hypothetical protein [Bacteroidia bacterium]